MKIFTTDIRRRARAHGGFRRHLGSVQVLKASGGLGVIHSEDNDIVMHMRKADPRGTDRRQHGDYCPRTFRFAA